jgi:hypothetical protein
LCSSFVLLVSVTDCLAQSVNFGAATNFAVGTRPLAVAAADFNRDGIPDLAVANQTSGTVSILLGTEPARSGS